MHEASDATRSHLPQGILQSVHQKLHLLRWEYLILALVGLSLIALAMWGLKVSDATREPRKVSDSFVGKMLSNDTSGAYALTAEPYRQSQTMDQLALFAIKLQTQMSEVPKVVGYRTESTSAGAYVATVEYKSPDKNGQPLIVKLIKENDNWRVLTINNTQ